MSFDGWRVAHAVEQYVRERHPGVSITIREPPDAPGGWTELHLVPDSPRSVDLHFLIDSEGRVDFSFGSSPEGTIWIGDGADAVRELIEIVDSFASYGAVYVRRFPWLGKLSPSVYGCANGDREVERMLSAPASRVVERWERWPRTTASEN